MACSECGDKKENAAKDFTKAVVEINNPEKIVLFRKVVVPASIGTEEDYPASVGKFYNVLLQYEANGDTYLYSSDGIPTMLSTDVSELQRELDQLGIKVDNEITDRISADDTLTSSVNSLSSSLSAEVTARTNADTALQTAINNEKTARQNADNTLQTNINTEKTARENADTALGNRLTTVEGIASTALQPAAIDKVVMTDLNLNANPSTTTVQLDGSKENLLSGTQTTKNIPLPVASHNQAGVMNSATFDAITKNTQDIANIKGEVVAITGLPASPSQARLTEEWLAASGETELINGAGIFDATNNKVWTYYLNDTTWHMTDASGSVQISNFTNDTPGLIKGSTVTGQVFAESNGTGSVNGWDTLSSAVSSNTSNIGSLQTTVAGKQDKLVAGTNINIAADGKTVSATVNDATLTIQQNGSTVQTFTANASANKTASINATRRTVLTNTYHDSQRFVIALCQVNEDNVSQLNSYSIGTIYFKRPNGSGGIGELSIGAMARYHSTGVTISGYSGNRPRLGRTIDIATNFDPGWRPCTFTYNGTHYGGIECLIDNAGTIMYSHGEGNFTPFLVFYYKNGYQGATPEIINQEIYDSLNYDNYTINSVGGAGTNFVENLDVRSGHIYKNEQYDLTLPDKDGTLATTADIPSVDTNLSTSSSNPLKNSSVSRFTDTNVPAGTVIPANADLNSITYLKIGTFYVSSSTSVSTFLNCPTTRAFKMVVTSPIQTTYDNESTGTWVYRVRKITDYAGNQWIQHAESGDVAGQFSYGSWQRITTDSKLIYTRNNLSPASDTPADWITLFNDEASTNVTKTGAGYYVTYYNTASRFTNQPSTYGYLETIINPSGLYQRWKVSASGHIFYRSGTSSAWADSDTSGAFIPLSEGNQATWYGTCSAEATDTALTTTISGFKLVNGIRVSIKFENGHTTSDPTTLNVSGTGAKAVVREDSTSTNLERLWRAKQVMDFVYDGTNYVVVNGVKATTNYYGVTMLSNSVTSTGTGTAATSSAVKTAYDLAGTKAKITMSATDPGEGAAIGDNEFIAVYT